MRFAIFAVSAFCALSAARTDFSAWKDSVRVYFNTSSTGAALTAPVKNFPLLVRLDSANFKLRSAAPGGADIRFADPDGAELPCRIARWDTGFYRSAEVWVNVPQVDAGSTSDFVIMYWGNPAATMTGAVKARQGGSDVVLGGDNPVESRVVFDTQFGFSAVWHLDEDVAGIGARAAYRDATPAGNHGDDSASDPSGSGVIGRAQQFDAGKDYIVAANTPSLQLQSTMSFSAWIKSSRFSGIGGVGGASRVNPIVRKGSVNPNPYQFCVAGGHLLLALDSNDYGGVQSPLALETGKWIHVGGAWDGMKVQLYVNGNQVIDKAPPRTANLKNDARPLYIGGRPINANDEASLDLFDGIIDEVQVSRAARGKEWYKLSYENQKPGSSLIRFQAMPAFKDTAKTPVVPDAEEYSTWAHSRKILLNTSPTGADVPADVDGFPLLVRLQAPAFDFSQAQPLGTDVRFADPDGTHLPVSIERWGPSQAELWTRVPRIDGGGKSDFIMMYWGKPGAADRDRASAVFDTGDGWSGVWHMGDGAAGRGTPGAYKDATANGNDGYDSAAANPSEGMIGLGQSFGGGTAKWDHVAIPADASLNPADAFTFSAWIKGSAFSGGITDVNPILRKGEANDNIYQFYVHQGNPALGLETGDNGGVFDHTLLETGKWHHLAATWGGDEIQFYVNGARTGSMPTAIATLEQDGRSLYIGGRGALSADDTTDQFDGMLDEVGFARIKRDPEWIKLAYENQRPDSRVLEFVPATDTVAVVPGPETSDTVLAPGQSFIRSGQIRVGNPADAEGTVRVRFLPAVDQSARGISEAGEIISLQPGQAGGIMPPVSVEINAGLSGHVSLFLILEGTAGMAGTAGTAGTGKVRSFGVGVGSWLLSDAGEYFLGRDTVAPSLQFLAEGVTEDDSSWIEVRPVDNVENLVLLSAAGGLPGRSETFPTEVAAAVAGKPLRLAFKGKAGQEPAKVTLQLRDGTLEGWFPAAGAAYPLVRRVAAAKSPVGLKGDLAWSFVGIPLALKERLRFSDISGGAKEREVFGAIWENGGADWNGTAKPGEYRVLKDDDSLPTATGIWLAGRSSLDSLALGEAFTNTPGAAGAFSIRLVKGWNQVSSPALENLAWPVTSADTVGRDLSRVKVLQGIHPVTGGYVDVDSLEPWRGFFVHSALDTSVRLQAQAGGAGKRAVKRAAKSAANAAENSAGGAGINREMVPVQIVLEPVGSVPTAIGAVSPIRLGAALYAGDRVGDEDEPMPPAAAHRSSLAAVRSGKGLKSDLLGFRPAGEFTWKLAWSSREAGPASVARLRIASLRLPPGMALWSISPMRKLAQPAAVGAELDVQVDAADTLIFWAAPAGRSFRGWLPGYGPAPSVRSAEWLAGPGGGVLRLALPEAAGVAAECRDASGRRLATLRRAGLAPGHHEFAWDVAWDRSAGAARAQGLMIITVRFYGGAGPSRMSFKSVGR